MKIKSTVGLLVAVTMVAFIGSTQASMCSFQEPGWHMVSKKCNIQHAESWQQYGGGVYLQPMTDQGIFSMMMK